MQLLLAVWHNPYFQMGLGGALVAAHVDYAAFTAFKSADEAIKYDWGIAAWRWFKGFVMGLVGAKLFA